MIRKSVAVAAVLFILGFVLSSPASAGHPGQAAPRVAPPKTAAPQAAAPQPAPPEKAKAEAKPGLKPEAKAEARPEAKPEDKDKTIQAGPQNIKERSAVYVFLVWLWLAIGSLIYVFALKIREADRVFSLSYYQPDQGPGKRRPQI